MASVCSCLEVLLGIWMAEADRSRGVYIEHGASQPASQKVAKVYILMMCVGRVDVTCICMEETYIHVYMLRTLTAS